MIPNKKYYLIKDNDRYIYAVNKDGYIQIFVHDMIEDKDSLWLHDRYCDMRFITKNDIIENSIYCYIILKSCDGMGHIVDLATNKTVLENFRYSHFDGYHKYVTLEDSKTITHILLRINNRAKKQYSIYSTAEKKYIIGPVSYDSIEVFKNGVILNNTCVIENNSHVIDLSEYSFSEKSKVYINKKENLYIFRFDYDTLFHYLHKSRKKGILTARVQYTDYYYDIAEDKFYRKSPSGLFAGWTKRELAEAADIAYEGHSRLELGLED